MKHSVMVKRVAAKETYDRLETECTSKAWVKLVIDAQFMLSTSTLVLLHLQLLSPEHLISPIKTALPMNVLEQKKQQQDQELKFQEIK